MEAFDSVVVGLGLAGAAVAWELRRRGRRVLVIDRGEPGTASRVAAGLVTPVTGLRLALTPRLDEFYPVAVSLYRHAEAETGEGFFVERPAIRFFTDAAERATFERRRRRGDPAFGATTRLDPAVNADWFTNPHGGFEMTTAARLDVPRYLDATRGHFARGGCFLAADLDPARDLEVDAGGVRLPHFDVRAESVVFCDGPAGRANPWLAHVAFTPAKGEVLTLRIPDLAEDRVTHRGVWLAPAGGDVFRAGSTYDRDDLSPVPTARGRDEITGRLREFLRLPFEVLGHDAAVRPVVASRQPVSGLHPGHPRVAFLNGLGSKGVLLAPWHAARLAEMLTAR